VKQCNHAFANALKSPLSCLLGLRMAIFNEQTQISNVYTFTQAAMAKDRFYVMRFQGCIQIGSSVIQSAGLLFSYAPDDKPMQAWVFAYPTGAAYHHLSEQYRKQINSISCLLHMMFADACKQSIQALGFSENALAVLLDEMKINVQPSTNVCVAQIGIFHSGITIYYNPGIPKWLQMWSLAHEIGHVAMGHLKNCKSRACKAIRYQVGTHTIEQQANAFVHLWAIPSICTVKASLNNRYGRTFIKNIFANIDEDWVSGIPPCFFDHIATEREKTLLALTAIARFFTQNGFPLSDAPNFSSEHIYWIARYSDHILAMKKNAIA